jgi:N-acetylneuraminic acid mutarotase
MVARNVFQAISLSNGQVLAIGGLTESPLTYYSSAELYNPNTGKWAFTGAMADRRCNFAAALLSDGKVLVAGGYAGGGRNVVAAEVYNPQTGGWSSAGSMAGPRNAYAMAALEDGSVLVSGGSAGGYSLFRSSEL